MVNTKVVICKPLDIESSFIIIFNDLIKIKTISYGNFQLKLFNYLRNRVV